MVSTVVIHANIGKIFIVTLCSSKYRSCQIVILYTIGGFYCSHIDITYIFHGEDVPLNHNIVYVLIYLL